MNSWIFESHLQKQKK